MNNNMSTKKKINRHKLVYMEIPDTVYGIRCLFCLEYRPHEPSNKYLECTEKEIRRLAKRDNFSAEDTIKAKGKLDECRGQHYKGSG